MADFKTHLGGAAAISAVLTTGLVAAEIVDSGDAVGLFSTAVVGGLLPDIDLGHSTPVTLARRALTIFGIIVVALQLAGVYSTVEVAIVALGMYFVIQSGFRLFDNYTKHRGLFHSIPAAIVCALILGVLLDNFSGNSDTVVWFYIFFLFLGFIVHLSLDEMYSVNLLGASFKRSFGTALKLGSRKNLLGTAGLYAFALLLLLIAPPTENFLDVVLDGSTYSALVSNLWPDGTWFESLN